MQNSQLIVNNFLVDFSAGDDPIQLIYQVNDLGDIATINGNGSKSFKLPLTQRNRIILGFPDDITITTKIPYKQLPAKLIVDGIEVISNGIVEIQDFQNGYVDVLLLFGNVDFLDKIGGQIYDMGDSTSQWSGFGAKKIWTPYDHIWNVQNAAYSQQKTDGWIWPIVNYGDVDIIPPYNGFINVRNQRPGFFLHTAIDLLVQSTGYSINYVQSCLYNDPKFANLYRKLIIQFDNSDFEHGSDYQNTPDNLGVTLISLQDQAVGNLPRVPIVSSSDIHQNGFPFEGVLSFGGVDHYEVPGTATLNFTASLQFDLFMRGRYTGTPSEVIIKYTVVSAADGSQTDFAAISKVMDPNYHRIGSGDGAHITGQETFLNQKLSQDFSLVPGDKLYVKYHINNIGSNIESTFFIMRKGATLSVVTNEQEVTWGSMIQCERILPNISQVDFLKDTLQRFGLILISDPNSGTIIFTSLKTIVGNIPKARDWSDKVKDMGKQVNFQSGNYCQENWLRIPSDSSIPVNYLAPFYFDDKIIIDDETLNPNTPSQDLFTSAFGPSINSPYLGGTIAQISDPTSTETFSPGSTARLLVDQKLYIGNLGPGGQPITVTFTDADNPYETVSTPINDWISVPYFYKPDAPDLSPAPNHLSWKDINGLPGLKTSYYQEFENVLTETKIITRYFYLTPADVQNFDFTIPVYLRQDSAYFYVSKIDSLVFGKPVKVTLVRL